MKWTHIGQLLANEPAVPPCEWCGAQDATVAQSVGRRWMCLRCSLHEAALVPIRLKQLIPTVH